MRSSELQLQLALPLNAHNAGRFVSRGQGAHPGRIIDSHELIFVSHGCLGISEAGQEFLVRSGHYLILFPGRPHQGTLPYPPDLCFYWIHFGLHERRAYRSRRPQRLRLPQHGRVPRPERMTELFRWFLDDQEHAFVRAPAADLILAAMLLELEAGHLMPAPMDDALPRALAFRAWQYIRAHFHEDLSTAGIARHLRCNPDYLGREFRKVHGSTLTRAIHAERMRHARRALIDGTLNIDEIARACGYPDPGYFRRIFRRTQGMSPSRFRGLYSRMHVNTG